MNAVAPGILEDFIASEDEALVQSKQGDFYLPNHHLIKPLVSTAASLLDDTARQRLFFHLLRMGELPPVKSDHDFGLLLAAYGQTVPLYSEGFPSCSLQHSLGLLAFGYDDHGVLPGEPECSADSYRLYAMVWAQCNAYTAIPYMLAHAGEFSLYAQDPGLAARILKLLRHIDYLHTHVGAQEEARYPITRLWFWALMFIALLNPATAVEVVPDFLSRSARLPRYADQLRILSRYIDAVARPGLRGTLCAATGASF